MIQKNLSWESIDGLNFFGHVWEPDSKPKAIITLVHGFGEHCMRYAPYLDFFIKEGSAVFGFDLRGHGQTEGKRGVVPSYKMLLDDVDMALDKVRELFPNIPLFLYGHSMGGNIALNYLLQRNPELEGGIITSPWLQLTKDLNPVLKRLVFALNRMIPNVTLDSGLDINYISTLKTEVDKYKNDPLNHGRISFRLMTVITQSGLWAIDNTSKLTVPVLLMHGSADQITSPEASKKAAQNNTEKIEFSTWDNKYHELHNEDIRPELAQKVIHWINKSLTLA